MNRDGELTFENLAGEFFIKQNYLTMPIKTIARRIGRSQCYVRGYMKRQGLVVPPDIIEQRKRDSRYKKGQVPPNKGKKQNEYMSQEAIERTRATRFKKGNLPHNTRKDGDLSLRRENSGHEYWYIRKSKCRWELLHRESWRKTHGPIPRGHCVQFKDGDTTNCDPENLYLVDRKTQVRVNQLGGHKLPYDLRKTIELTYKLKSKIDAKK